MADIIVAQRMYQRRGTAAEWVAANPVLQAGEIGVELSTPPTMKIGDGVTPWNTLPYAGGSAAALVGATFDGGGGDISAGTQHDQFIPFAFTITKVTLLADAAGSIVIDIWKDTYGNYPPTAADKITASAPPTLSSASKGQDSTLTGWTKAVAAGSTLRFNVTSCTGIKRCQILIEGVKG